MDESDEHGREQGTRMSIITVNDGDSAQAKLDGAAPGDTIQFAGVTLNATLQVRKALILSGTLTTARSVYAFEPLADNITADHLTLDGLLFRMSAYRPANLLAQNCTFTVREGSGAVPIPNIPNWCLIGWNANGAPKSLRFINNVIATCEAWCVVFGLQGNNVEIGNNTFANRQNPANPQNEGRYLKFFGQGANEANGILEGRDNSDKLTCGGFWIHHNYFGSCRGMAAEIQDGFNGNRWEDNFYETPIAVGNNWQQNSNVWCFSLVESRSVNCQVRRNYINGRLPAGVNSGCFRVAIEGGGFNQIIEDNYIELNGTGNSADGSGNSSIAINGSNASGKVRNNRIVNAPPPFNNGQTGAHMELINNGPSVSLTWDINRPKPGPGTSPTPEPPVPPVPTYTLTATPSGDPKTGTITFASNLPTPATIVCKSTSIGETGPQVGPQVAVSSFPIIVGGYHPGWDLSLRATGAAGQTDWVKVKMPGDPNTNPWPPVAPEPPMPADDPIVKVETLITTKSGKQTKATANVP